jgi:REP element-mobilizing transposase RayT
MARALRVEYPGAFYHVINRGNAGDDIFKSLRDREKFLEYLQTAVDHYGLKIHTYCLMTNHYHLLVETPEANLSRAIKWVNVSYAGYFNRKRQRHGHLFQGRYKAILVDADEYLKQLSRYIHLNPIRANMVAELCSYPFSSYPAFIGQVKAPKWLELNWLLSLFGQSRRSAAKNYRDFVEKVDIANVENPAKDISGGFILGGVEFVNWIKESFLSNRVEKKEIPQLRLLKPRKTPVAIVEAVCQEFNCQADQILRKGAKKNTARDVAIYLARELSGESGVDLGKYFGNICGAAVTVRYKQISEQISRNRRLKGRVNRVKNRIVNN